MFGARVRRCHMAAVMRANYAVFKGVHGFPSALAITLFVVHLGFPLIIVPYAFNSYRARAAKCSGDPPPYV